MSSDYYRAVAGTAADRDGNPLGCRSDRVAAWRIGVQYTAVVKAIGDYEDGCTTNFPQAHFPLVRDDDGTEVEGFSNLVMVIQPAGAPRSRHFPSGHYTDKHRRSGRPRPASVRRMRRPDRLQLRQVAERLQRAAGLPGVLARGT